MKRLLAAIGALGLLLAVAPDVAGAAPAGDVNGPSCADVSDGAGVYDGSTVNLRLTTSAPACGHVTYTLNVLTSDGSSVLASSAQRGSGDVHVFYAVPASGGTTVCVYATTSSSKHVFDRAPDTGCIQLVVDGGVSAQAMR
jgi:hypothetical protein